MRNIQDSFLPRMNGYDNSRRRAGYSINSTRADRRMSRCNSRYAQTASFVPVLAEMGDGGPCPSPIYPDDAIEQTPMPITMSDEGGDFSEASYMRRASCRRSSLDRASSRSRRASYRRYAGEDECCGKPGCEHQKEACDKPTLDEVEASMEVISALVDKGQPFSYSKGSITILGRNRRPSYIRK